MATRISPSASPAQTARLTHPDRVYWPDAGLTKQDLADYYAAVWPLAAPHLVDRPLALVRCPEGVDGRRFFQKHLWKGARRAIRPVHDPKDRDATPLIAIADVEGLMGLVQAAAVEIHPWGSTLADWEAPDRIVMDLDPGPDVPWAAIVAAAREVAQRLEATGLSAFVKTTGGKGLHVVSPLKPKARWREAKAFSKALAIAMAADSPERYVATISKAKRRGRVLIDYLRNQRGATAVAPYSVRAFAGAPLSMPLDWVALDTIPSSSAYGMGNVASHLSRRARDPWGDFAAAAIPLEETISRQI